MAMRADFSDIVQDTGYESTVKLEEGLKIAIDWSSSLIGNKWKTNDEHVRAKKNKISVSENRFVKLKMKEFAPKGIRKLKDTTGKEVDYDIPLPVFSPGSEAGILEQLVLSLYFRGGDAIIDRPYVVRQVKQPLTTFFINQLCLWNISRLRTDTLEGVAEYFCS